MKRSILSVVMLSLIVVGCSDAGSKKSGNEGGSDAAKGDIKAGVKVDTVGTTDVLVVPVEEKLLVNYNLPHISEVEAIDRNNPIVYIYIGTPATEELRERYGTAPRVQFEGSFKTPSDIPAFIEEKRRHLNEEDRANMCVCLKADRDVKMRMIDNVEMELRRAGVFKICYAAPSEYSSKYGDAGLMRVLPPMPNDDMENEYNARIKERNILMVRVNRANDIFVGLGNKKREVMELEVLKDEAKKFVLNVSNDENLPEKKPTDIAMPDGSTWVYPVSSGVISLLCDADANYEWYMEVQNELTRAFNEIRNEASIKQFGKEFKRLSVADKAAITKAVPMKILEAADTPPLPPQKVDFEVLNEVLEIVTKDQKIETEINFDEEFGEDVEFVQQVEVAEKTDKYDQPFIKVEQMPKFQGGDLGTFRNWVMSRLRYPQIAQENGIQGRVLLAFVIEKDGSLTNIQVLQSPVSVLSDEAIRILKSSPKWTPGKQGNQNARVKFTLPLEFRLQN